MKMVYICDKILCNFVKTFHIVTTYLTNGLPSLENIIIYTNIMKIGLAFPRYDQYWCPVAAILDLEEAFISQSASIDLIK